MRTLKLIAKNTISHSLGIAVALFFTIAGARLLTQEDYGELRFAMTLLPLLMAFSLPGYDSIILRNANLRKPIPLLRIFYVRLSGALIGSFLILGGILIYHRQMSASLLFFLVTIMFALPLFDTGTGYRNYLIGKRLRDISLTLVLSARVSTLLLIAGLFTLVYALDLPRIYIFPAYVIAMIVPTILIFVPMAIRQKDKNNQRARNSISLDLHAALAATSAGLVYTLAYSLDKLWVRQELGAAQLASYAILVMAPQELSKLFDATVPLFYRKLFFDKQSFALHQMRKVFLLFPIAAVIYVVLFYLFSGLVFGVQYQYPLQSVILSGLMMGGLSFEYLNNHRIFATLGSRALFKYSLLNMVITGPVVVMALRFGGIDGLMLGLTVKQIVTPQFYFYLHQRVLHVV